MYGYINENRTDNLPRLWQENTTKLGRRSFEKLPLYCSKYRQLQLVANRNFQFEPLLLVLNLIRNNAFIRGAQMNTPLNTPNGTIVKIVSFSLS